MNQESTMQLVERLVREFFEDYTGPITAETSAADIEDWDSLAHVQLLVLVEQETGTRFSTAEITGLKNLGALVELIEKYSASS